MAAFTLIIEHAGKDSKSIPIESSEDEARTQLIEKANELRGCESYRRVILQDSVGKELMRRGYGDF